LQVGAPDVNVSFDLPSVIDDLAKLKSGMKRFGQRIEHFFESHPRFHFSTFSSEPARNPRINVLTGRNSEMKGF